MTNTEKIEMLELKVKLLETLLELEKTKVEYHYYYQEPQTSVYPPVQPWHPYPDVIWGNNE